MLESTLFNIVGSLIGLVLFGFVVWGIYAFCRLTRIDKDVKEISEVKA